MEAPFERTDRQKAQRCSFCRSALVVTFALLSASSSIPREAAGFCVSSAFSSPAAPRSHRVLFVESSMRTRWSLGMMAYIDENSSGGGSGRKGNDEIRGTGAAAEASEVEAGTPGVQGVEVGEETGYPSINEKRIDYTGAGTLGDIISDDDEEIEENSAAVSSVNATTADRPATDIGPGPSPEHSALLNHRQKSPTKSGLVTSAGGTLQSRFSSKVGTNPLSPLDRIALTANGNLQRIFSSYYDAPVHVHVDRCELRRSLNGIDLVGYDGMIEGGMIGGEDDSMIAAVRPLPPATWDRTVRLSVHGRTFCVATSVITVRDPECVRLVHSGAVGIGQLFRHLDKLPTFELIDAGRRCSVGEADRGDSGADKVNGASGIGELERSSQVFGSGSGEGGNRDGGMWRLYALRCNELECTIREDFSPDAWEIQPKEVDHYEEHDNTF